MSRGAAMKHMSAEARRAMCRAGLVSGQVCFIITLKRGNRCGQRSCAFPSPKKLSNWKRFWLRHNLIGLRRRLLRGWCKTRRISIGGFSWMRLKKRVGIPYWLPWWQRATGNGTGRLLVLWNVSLRQSWYVSEARRCCLACFFACLRVGRSVGFWLNIT